MTRALTAMSMQSAYCRTEEKRTRWTHAGYATTTGAENTVRPRASYIACVGCTLTTLRLGDVFDAFGLCLAVEKEWRRRSLGRTVSTSESNRPQQSSGIRYDVDDIVASMFEHVWKLYTKWDPRRLTFASYATGILRKKIHTFIGNDLGDAAGNRVTPKAHSGSVCESLDALTHAEAGDAVGDRLVFAYGRGSLDAAGSGVSAGGGPGPFRDSGHPRHAVRRAGEATGTVEGTAARAQ